jgi:hypothetical protein
MDLSWPPSLGSSTADLIAKSVPSSAGSLPTASAKPGTSTDGLAEILEKKQEEMRACAEEVEESCVSTGC